MLLAIVIGIWATLLAAKGTPFGDTLHRWLVDKPAARLSHIHRRTVIAVLALILIGVTCSAVIGKEGLLLYSMALPELTMALAMIDLGVMVDVAVLLVATVASGGWRAAVAMVTNRVRGTRTTRARRTRRTRTPAANDDGEGPAFARAA